MFWSIFPLLLPMVFETRKTRGYAYCIIVTISIVLKIDWEEWILSNLEIDFCVGLVLERTKTKLITTVNHLSSYSSYVKHIGIYYQYHVC